MMSRDEIETVKLVYNRFIQSELTEGHLELSSWTEIDNNLEILEYLSEEELVNETRVRYEQHNKGVFRCSQDHDIKQCFAPVILEGVEAILKLFDDTKDLHPKNAYVLMYYLAMSEMGMILVD